MHQRRKVAGWPPFLVRLGSAEDVRPLQYFLFQEVEGDESSEVSERDKDRGARVLVAPNAGAEEEGPWEVPAAVRGGAGTPFDRDVELTLTVPADYPARPLQVRVEGITRHLMLTDANEPVPMFYNSMNLPPGEDGTYDLPTTVLAVHRLFSAPLRFPESTLGEGQLEEIEEQWAEAAEEDAKRRATIEAYRPQARHPELFEGDLREEWFDLAFVQAVLRDGSAEAVRAFVKEECAGAYSFPMFTPAFCGLLIDEAEHYQASGLPVRRPNSMNAYGLILNDGIGLESFIDALQRRALQPVARALFPQEGCRLDGHHAFLVHYQQGKDLGLDTHTDDSDVTFNTALGKEFTGAGLSLCGMMGGAGMRKLRHVYRHVVGRCLVHLGRHRHGADDIQSGERINLIVWNHNSLWRKSTPYRSIELPDETDEPDAVCVSYTHDRDYEQHVGKALTEAQALFAKRAWYPPLR